jgi:hypothetical protein
MLKKTINVVVRFDEEQLAIAEQKRSAMERELRSKAPGLDFTISAMLRSLAIAGMGTQRKQRVALHNRAMQKGAA